MRQRSIGETSMTNENEALRRFDDVLKRIEALEEQLERAIRAWAMEALVLDASADVDELAVSLGEPSP
jgi:exonuclease VII small subunit